MKPHPKTWHCTGYVLVLAMQIIMGAVGLQLFFVGDDKHASLSFLALALTLLPFLFNHLHLRFAVPIAFIVAYTAFVFAGMFVGEVFYFYTYYPDWDAALHLLSGLLAVSFGYWLVLQLKKHYGLRARLWFMLLFAVCLSITLGASWEIVEFTSDELLGTTSQEESLQDTMYDIVLNAVASIGTAAGVALYAKFWHPPSHS